MQYCIGIIDYSNVGIRVQYILLDSSCSITTRNLNKLMIYFTANILVPGQNRDRSQDSGLMNPIHPGPNKVSRPKTQPFPTIPSPSLPPQPPACKLKRQFSQTSDDGSSSSNEQSDIETGTISRLQLQDDKTV